MQNLIFLSLCLLTTATNSALGTLSIAEANTGEHKETNSLFYQACDNGSWETFSQLLHTTEVNIYETNKNGWTPLHMCVVRGDYKKVKALTDTFGYTNIQDNQGSTPLFLAAVVGNADIVGLLLNSGEDVTTPYMLKDGKNF